MTSTRLQYVTAGKAVFTLVSRSTGTRFTYSVRAARNSGRLWVSVLTGPDNTSDYEFIGGLTSEGCFYYSDRSRISPTAPSVVAFAWAARHGFDHERLEFLMSERCARCARLLTDAESIRTGLGPTCRRK